MKNIYENNLFQGETSEKEHFIVAVIVVLVIVFYRTP